MTAIVFVIWFFWYGSIAQRLPSAQYYTSSDIYGLVLIFLLPLFFSAFESTRKGESSALWGFIFGFSFTFGMVLGYNYFIGYPVWLAVLYIMFLGIFFALVYGFGGAFLGSIFSGIWKWQKSAQLRARKRMRTSHINELKIILAEHDSLLSQRKNLEEKINEVIAFDPTNLELRKSSFRKQASNIDDSQISKRLIEIHGQKEETVQLRKQHERTSRDLENKRHKLEDELQNCERELRKLESNDPANVGIRLQKLHDKWDRLTQEELEKMKPASQQEVGNLEWLFRRRLLLGFHIEVKTRELEREGKEIAHLSLAERILTLENLVLELEEKDREIKSKEPELLELKEELRRLETEDKEPNDSLA